jgi:uncharacterized protein YeaO (DUF488 family)
LSAGGEPWISAVDSRSCLEVAGSAPGRLESGLITRRPTVSKKPDVRLRRIYDDPTDDDGIRVLVERRWPRGVSTERAELDEWCSEVAPSDALRKWYAYDPDRFEEFGSRYRRELEDPRRASALRRLQVMAAHERLTLLTTTTRLDLSQAAVLAALLRTGEH